MQTDKRKYLSLAIHIKSKPKVYLYDNRNNELSQLFFELRLANLKVQSAIP